MNSTPFVFGDPGLWLGFLLTLMTFSLLLRNNVLARLAQYLLVGTALGYLASIVVKEVLLPRLLMPVFTAPVENALHLVPLLLCLFLIAAALERALPAQQERPFWRRFVNSMGIVPLALLLGIGIAVGLVGMLQGTLLPQFWRAARIGVAWEGPGNMLLPGLLTLLVTTGAMIHLYVIPPRAGLTDRRSLPFSGRFLALWAWLGKRALWLAAGFLFARLLASRFSFFIARVDYVRSALQDMGVWPLLESAWQAIVR